MSRLIVADNAGTPWVEIAASEDLETWVATCSAHGVVAMHEDHRDVVEEAEIHVDNEHEGNTEQ